jgi:hypothetical protein
MQYVDVVDRSELPAAPEGFRYLDFMGGSKELRCYLVPRGLPRAKFMSLHRALLDEALQPIYEHRGICVGQDTSYALPGFFIVALDQQYAAMDRMDERTHLRLSFLIREVRQGMRAVLGTQYIHLHYEEKPDASTNVHYWLLPADTVIMRLNLREYLKAFRFSEQRSAICASNDKMRAHFQRVNLRERDDDLVDRVLRGLE